MIVRFPIIAVVLYALSYCACGLKLSPKSEISDFRPATPFKPESEKPKAAEGEKKQDEQQKSEP